MYSLPAVALRVLELTATSHVDVSAVADCVEQDPALTTKILRVVNSSMYGLTQRVGTVKQSIALLGTQPLKMLVLGFSLPGNLASNSGSLVLQRYWQQTLLIALGAREIAESWFQLNGDDAFAAGLLQDLGELVLVQDLGESYERFLVSVWQQGGDTLTEERRVLGFDHRTLTAKMLEHWHLPESFVRSIEQSQHATSIGEEPLAHVLHLASRVAAFLVDRDPGKLKELLEIAEHSCDATMSKLELLIGLLDKRTPQLAQLLSLELPDEMVYSDVLLQAYKRLSEATDQAAAHWILPTDRPGLVLGKQTVGISPSDPAFDLLASGAQSAVRPPTAEAPPSDLDTRTPPPGSPRFSRAGLITRVAAEVARCRQARSAISLVVVELDSSSDRTILDGSIATKTIERLDSSLQEIAESEGKCLRLNDRRFAILTRHDRRRAVDLGWRITDGVRSWSDAATRPARMAISVSVGVATLSMPPRNFPAEELLTAAERCLTGVQLSGGDGVKSIDIY